MNSVLKLLFQKDIHQSVIIYHVPYTRGNGHATV